MRDYAEATAAECWLAIPGYEGHYDVSDRGNVRSHKRRGSPGRELRPARDSHSYLTVSLWRNGCGRTWAVHRLVARAFLGPCPPGQETLHGPRGQLDNRLDNLRYGTSQENSDDQLRDGTRCRGEARWNAVLTVAAVTECRIRHASGDSQAALAREFGISLTAMHNAIRGKNWRSVA